MQAVQNRKQNARPSEEDNRPRFSIGHISVPAAASDELADFYISLGMRPVAKMGRMAIVELRGGTHIVFHAGQAGVSTLDLMVDDIDETHALLAAHDGAPSAITRGNPHDSFTATDPEGNALTIHSSHAMGPV